MTRLHATKQMLQPCHAALNSFRSTVVARRRRPRVAEHVVLVFWLVVRTESYFALAVSPLGNAFANCVTMSKPTAVQKSFAFRLSRSRSRSQWVTRSLIAVRDRLRRLMVTTAIHWRPEENVRPLPDDRMISSALNEMLRAEGLVSNAPSIEVSSVVGSLRPAYHVHVHDTHTTSISAVLARLLDRAFSSSHSGWLIDEREARTLIEEAHRLAKLRTG